MKARILGLLKTLPKLNNPWVIRGTAILLFTSTAAGGVYLGIQRFGGKTVEGTPTKKVVTGVTDGAAPASDLATASLAPPTTLPTSPGMPPSTSAPYSSTSSSGKYGDYGQSSYSDDSAPVNPYRRYR